MSQTDRQTDKPATHWKSAIFGLDDNWEKLDTLPPFVKEVHKQKEICPTTGNPHFQVHVVCHRQVRLTQMSSWIKATKWISVFGKQHIENSIKYTAKSESAVAGTHEVVQGEKYLQMHELLELIAKEYDHPERTTETTKDSVLADAISFETLTSRMVRRDVKWVNKLCNPQIKKMWEMYKWVFVSKMWEHLDETCGAYIIESPAPEEETEEGYLIED